LISIFNEPDPAGFFKQTILASLKEVKMRVVSLINMKGGVAKTTVAINLAQCLVERHNKRVLLIDVDPQFNATQCLMSPENYYKHLQSDLDTVLNVFDRNQRMMASAVKTAAARTPKKLADLDVVRINNNFDLLPGNLELYRLEMAPGDGRENRLKTYLSKVKDDYDYVVIDTPPTPSIWMTSALIASDFYLIPVKADPLSLTGIDLLRSIIEEKKENFDLKIACAGLVLTLTEQQTRIYKSAYTNLKGNAHWSKYLYPVTLPKRTTIARKQIDQIQILDSDDHESKMALTKITTEFLSRVKDDE
jgi:chromosome partitioning protein